MTLFKKTAQATHFHALKGVSGANHHAPKKGSNFFQICRSYITRIKSLQLYAMICIRKFPQRLEYWWDQHAPHPKIGSKQFDWSNLDNNYNRRGQTFHSKKIKMF